MIKFFSPLNSTNPPSQSSGSQSSISSTNLHQSPNSNASVNQSFNSTAPVPLNQNPETILVVEVENKTGKGMQLIDCALNGKWFQQPPPFINPDSSVTLSTDLAGFFVYRFVLPNEDLNLGYNAIKVKKNEKNSVFEIFFLVFLESGRI